MSESIEGQEPNTESKTPPEKVRAILNTLRSIGESQDSGPDGAPIPPDVKAGIVSLVDSLSQNSPSSEAIWLELTQPKPHPQEE